MKASEFAKIATQFIENETETVLEFIKNEDWEGLQDEIFEYVSQGE